MVVHSSRDSTRSQSQVEDEVGMSEQACPYCHRAGRGVDIVITLVWLLALVVVSH